MTACPHPETLQRLGAESLDTEDFRALEAHVASCASCRELLERFARADSSGTPAIRPDPALAIPGCILGEELGRGGWGVVYEAEQTTLARRVAVKILFSAPGLDARARARWLREARAAAKVRHPNVVRLHDAGEHEGRLYLVFDLISGGSLRELARGPMDPDVAARIVETIAGAVHAIHRERLLHLDIKPSNLLMDGPPGASLDALTPMLSDFGIAREVSEDESDAETETLGGRGTPSYMAPEQVASRSGTIGPGADVFAMGATLYALLTGRPPFQGATPFETMDLVRLAEPVAPRALAPNVPRDLETICLKALQKSPTRRYASAEAMAGDLARWREGRPILARPVSLAERAARWCRRHPVPAVLASALAATVFLAFLGLMTLWQRAETARTRAIQGEQSADRMAEDLAGILREVVEAPEQFVSERSEDASLAVLKLTADLRRAPDLAVKHAVALASLELELARYRYLRADFDGAARLLEDAAGLLTLCYEAQPDAEVGARLAEALLRDAEASALAHRVDAAEANAKRAAAVLRTLPDGPFVGNEVVDLHISRRYIFYWMGKLGRKEQARELFRAHVEELAGLARRFPGSPAVGLIARFARAEYDAGADPAAAEWTRSLFAAFPKGDGVPPKLAVFLADLNARELLAMAAAAPASDDPKAVASSLLAEFDARCEASGASSRFRTDLVECLSQLGCVAALEARRAGRLGEARRNIGWMIAMGGMLDDRAEVLGGGHAMASRAHEQVAKLGWVEDDRAAIERGLRAALVEAVRAVDAAPEEAVPRALLAGIREKYTRFAADEPEHP